MSTVGRRDFLRLMGVGLVGVAAVACGEAPAPTPAPGKEAPKPAAEPTKPAAAATTAPTQAAAAPTKPAAATAAPATAAPAVTAPAAQTAGGQVVAASLNGPVNVAMPTKFKERPEFAKLVADGKLPPVEKRLPEKPMVMKNADIGKYGGTLFSAGNPFSHAFEIYAYIVDNSVTKMSPEYAEGVEASKDYSVYTLRLRKGIKWSTGEPFTSEDFVFWWEDYQLNKETNPAGPPVWSVINGKDVQVKAIDTYTVQFTFGGPNRPFTYALSNWNSLQGTCHDAKHYMKQWHIKYNPDANALAKKEGFDSWGTCFASHRFDCHRNGVKGSASIGPWLPVTWTSATHAWEANPYYFAVDTEGNQLPYLLGLTSAEGLNAEVQVAQGLSGQIHWLPNQKIADINIFKDNAQKGGYKVLLFKNHLGAQVGIGFNQAHKDAVKRKLFQDIRWRKAMAASINREEINKVVHFGTGTPQDVALAPEVSFYKPEWATTNAKYDPQLSASLLDEIGLKWDAQKKYRLGPDGKEFTLFFDRDERYTIFPIQEGELIRDYFEKVGIRTVLKPYANTLYSERRNGNDLDFGAWQCDRVEELRCYIPGATKWDPKTETSWGVPWAIWRDTQGKQGEEPPQKYKDLFALQAKWAASTTDEDYKKLGQQIWDFYVQDITIFGDVAWPQAPFLLSNKVGNGPPDGVFFGDGMNWYKTYLPATWYLKS